MWKALILGLAIATPTLAQAIEPVAIDCRVYVSENDDLNVRSAPNDNAFIIGRLFSGDGVTILDPRNTQHNWVFVSQARGKEDGIGSYIPLGWVYGDYLKGCTYPHRSRFEYNHRKDGPFPDLGPGTPWRPE